MSDVLCALNLLAWDSRTQMPDSGVEARGHQVATLTSLAREIATGPRMRDALYEARDRSPSDADEAALLADFARRVEIMRRMPDALLVELAQLKTTGHAAWIAARDADDYSLFSPVLARIFELQRELAEVIGYERHPYDALIDQYEPGMTLAQLAPLFGSLRDGITDVLAGLRDLRVDDAFLRRSYPIEAQRRFARSISERMGYDFARGRLDETTHPFEISMGRCDVRITSRFVEDDLLRGLFSVMHETGHGIYEQGVSSRWTRGIGSVDLLNLYAVGGASFGVHESQSKLYENRVGRSRRFWELHFGMLRDVFVDQLADVSVDGFWRAINRPRRGLVRIEADEFTYDAHIMLRVELEAALVAGEIAVADLPGIWNERMAGDFGLAVPDLRRGVLQDVHWSSGLVGSFATYTLGNVMSSQFFAAATDEPSVSAGLEEGRYEPLKAWLGAQVHRHGRSRGRERLLGDATGRGLDPRPYLADLRMKAEALR